MKNSSILFLVAYFCVIHCHYEENWATCEKFPNDFMCYNWCMRLNKYVEKYSEMKEMSEIKWQEIIKMTISFILPGTILVYIWIKIRTSFKIHRENLKRRRHEKKLKLLHLRKMRDAMVDRNIVDEPKPDSIREPPIRDEVVYKMRKRTKLQKKYLEFRQKKMLDLPKDYNDFEYACDEERPTSEIQKIENDPEFVDENVALEWDMNVPKEKNSNGVSEMYKTRKK